MANTYKKFCNIFNLFFLIIIFTLYSFPLIAAYTKGDQVSYRAYYEALNNTSASEVMLISYSYVSSSEPFSAYLFWSASQLGFDKDIFITFLNVIFLLGIYFTSKKFNVSFIVIILLLTNFYTVVLMTGAERLKIAYILLIWSIYFSGKKSFVLFLLSPFSHLQSFFLFPSLILIYISKYLKRLFIEFVISKRFLILVILAIGLFLVFYQIFSEGIVKKGSIYLSNETGFVDLTNVILLSLIAFIVTDSRWRMAMLLIPLYPAILLLGGERLNMVAFTLVLYQLMVEKKLNHPFFLILLLYFSVKSIPFINKIFLYGNGFASLT